MLGVDHDNWRVECDHCDNHAILGRAISTTRQQARKQAMQAHFSLEGGSSASCADCLEPQ